jgi:putative serine protease PepD
MTVSGKIIQATLVLLGLFAAGLAGFVLRSEPEGYRRAVSRVNEGVFMVAASQDGTNRPADGASLMPLGSGMVISADGYALTAAHVVAPTNSIIAVFANGDVRDGVVVAQDGSTDLALLRLDPRGQLKPVTLGHSAAPAPGDVVLAIGAPGGLVGSVSAGVVSGLDRRPNPKLGVGLIQHDAALSGGSSGGALINTRGQVVGINTAIFTANGANGPYGVGISFAVPATAARIAVGRMKASERLSPTTLPWVQATKSPEG